MIAVDTNILVHAHRPEMRFHKRAGDILRELAGARARVGPSMAVAHEFVCAFTRPGYFKTPTPTEIALDFLERLLARPGVQPLGYGPSHWSSLGALACPAAARGYAIYDARIAPRPRRRDRVAQPTEARLVDRVDRLERRRVRRPKGFQAVPAVGECHRRVTQHDAGVVRRPARIGAIATDGARVSPTRSASPTSRALPAWPTRPRPPSRLPCQSARHGAPFG